MEYTRQLIPYNSKQSTVSKKPPIPTFQPQHTNPQETRIPVQHSSDDETAPLDYQSVAESEARSTSHHAHAIHPSYTAR